MTHSHRSIHNQMKETSYQINQELLSERIGDEMILVDPLSGQYFQLNEVATRMLELLLTETSVKDIISQLKEQFDAPADLLRNDLTDFMQSLEDKGLLEFES